MPAGPAPPASLSPAEFSLSLAVGEGEKAVARNMYISPASILRTLFDAGAHDKSIMGAHPIRSAVCAKNTRTGLDNPRPMLYGGYMDSTPDQMTAELAGTPEARYPYQEGRAVQKLRYSHEAMIDQIVQNPWVTQGELAAMFGYTPGWVSLVMSSDAFKERLAARKEELVDPTIRATLNERWAAVEARSLEVLAEKLSQPVSAVPENLALRAAELGAKVRGVGGNAPPVVPSTGRLEELAARLVSFLPAPRPIYDVTPVEEVPSGK